MIQKLAAFLAVALLLAGCAGGPSRLPVLATPQPGPYILGPGDTLQVTVFGETDLSGAFKISDSGAISLPLIGAVVAQGMTVQQFAQKLATTLNTKAVRSPDVTIQISEYRPFFILGEVKNPGSYPYVPNMTVLTGIAIAGGYTYRASEEDVSVTRETNGQRQESRAPREARVLPGDVVYVYERHF